MTWFAPTPAILKQRFPEFASVADAQVQLVLDEAIAEVPEGWPDSNRTAGVLYLTGHLLASFGSGSSGTGGGGVAVTGAIKSRKVGDVSVEFAGHSGGKESGAFAHYSTTAYGKRYYEILRRNVPAIAWV